MMLATADCSSHFTEQMKYQNEWIDNHNIKVPWLNYLTAQSIPEETNSDSDCSSSSEEDCYVVLEIQRPRQINETTDKIEEENLYFAQINEDNHHVEHEQFAESMLIETSPKEYAVKRRTVKMIIVKEYATVTQVSNNILFHKPKISDKSIEQMETRTSTSSNNEHANLTNFKAIPKINKYQPTFISFVSAKQQSMNMQCSTTSLDSIENELPKTTPIQTRITTTFPHPSSQRSPNLIQTQRQNSAREKEISARTFTIDRTSKKKYGRSQEQKIDHVKTTCEQTKAPLPSPKDTNIEEPPPPPSFYLDIKSNPTANSSTLNSLSKTSALARLMKKHARQVTSEYELSNNIINEISSNEPTLLRVKYFDGRNTLTDVNLPEPSRQKRTLSSSLCSRLSLSKISSTQDLSINESYRKRMLNRVQTFLKTNSIEEHDLSSSRPWQQKTIMELFNERKFKDRKKIY